MHFHSIILSGQNRFLQWESQYTLQWSSHLTWKYLWKCCCFLQEKSLSGLPAISVTGFQQTDRYIRGWSWLFYLSRLCCWLTVPQLASNGTFIFLHFTRCNEADSTGKKNLTDLGRPFDSQFELLSCSLTPVKITDHLINTLHSCSL